MHPKVNGKKLTKPTNVRRIELVDNTDNNVFKPNLSNVILFCLSPKDSFFENGIENKRKW